MDTNTRGAVPQAAYWGLQHPWTGPVSYRTLALILAALLIAIYFAHDGVRIAKEHTL